MAENKLNQAVELIADILIDTSKEISANSGFDKTYIGSITEVMFNKDTLPTDDNYNKYKIRYGTLENDFIINDGKAHSLNEKVQVIVPCDKLKDKVVEAENYSHPAKIEYIDGKNPETVVIDGKTYTKTIDTVNTYQKVTTEYEKDKRTQAYARDEKTRELIPVNSFDYIKEYKITVLDKDKDSQIVKVMVFPDGSIMELKGF